MNQEELERLGLEWQKRLRLMDWEIAFRLEKAFHMVDTECNYNGIVPHSPMHKKAVIQVREVLDYGGDDVVHATFTETHEHVLVHELLELHFTPFKVTRTDDQVKHDSQELAINMIANALVQAKHGNGHTIESAMREEGVLLQSGT